MGAHYGYFSLLASHLVDARNTTGKVLSFEASPDSFVILQKNLQGERNMNSYNKAVSDSNSTIPFFEFPNLYSEYNSFNINQYKNKRWYKSFLPKEIVIETVSLDTFLSDQDIDPKIIKIDVEGAEFLVIKGIISYLQTHNPIIIMEYVNEKRGNLAHQEDQKF